MQLWQVLEPRMYACICRCMYVCMHAKGGVSMQYMHIFVHVTVHVCVRVGESMGVCHAVAI